MEKKFLMSKYLYFVIILTSILVISCDNEEENALTGVDRDPAPLSGDFSTSSMFLELTTSNTSTNGRAYSWDFGVENTDEDTSIAFEPTYTYEVGGTYLVTLTVSGDDGQEEVVVQEVTVAREMINPMAMFDSEIDLLDVTFTNTSVNGVSYVWDFGDQSEISEEENPTHSFPESGTYTVSLTATSETDDSDTITAEITVASPTPPAVAFSSLSTSVLGVDFTDETLANDGNITAYAWDFGDGSTSTMPSPSHTYSVTDNYQVTLTVTYDEIMGETTTSLTQNIAVFGSGGTATFPAAIQNGDMQSFPTAEMSNNDLVDAWTIDPDNTFNDGTDTNFDWWRNDDLEGWVSNPANNGGSGETDKASSSGTDAQSAGGTSGRSYKMDSSGERAYQPFEVEAGVLYNISAFVKSESTPSADVEGTFYVLSQEPADETDLASIALATVPVTANEVNEWQQVSFGFNASTTFTYDQSTVDDSVTDGGILTSTTQQFVILYFVPTNTVTSDNEVFLTDVVITTPSL